MGYSIAFKGWGFVGMVCVCVCVSVRNRGGKWGAMKLGQRFCLLQATPKQSLMRLKEAMGDR